MVASLYQKQNLTLKGCYEYSLEKRHHVVRNIMRWQSSAVQMSEQFTKYGIPYEFKSFDTGGHDLTEHKEEVDRALIGWFKKHLQDI